MVNPICLRKNITIGAPDAETDDAYLFDCFIETGDLDVLKDTSNPQCMVLGRTGAGKTALLRQLLKATDQSKELYPEDLSLSYIVNSNTLKFFEEIGVKLDVFYQLLWRHILTVELLKLRFKLTNSRAQENFLTQIKTLFMRDKAKERAFKYLQKWGDKFWEETEYRTKEFTQKLEKDLKAEVDVDSSVIHMGAQGVERLSSEQRVEVRARATRVVNAVQIKELHEVIEFLATDIFTNSQQNYYLVIDRLDEDWVEERYRFKLLKALIEAIKSFRKITSVKIVMSLRTDLYYHLVQNTQDLGFQEEKFKALYLNIKWGREQLAQLLSARVCHLFKHQYTRTDVKLVDLLPKNQIDKRNAVDYIIDRTFFRPREAIIFLNMCLEKAEGKSRVSIDLLRGTEVSYSSQRLDSLADEWRREYPLLKEYVNLLRQGEVSFSIRDIDKERCEDFVEHILSFTDKPNDPVFCLCNEYLTSTSMDYMTLLADVFACLYHVGIVGIKIDSHFSRSWSFSDQAYLSQAQILSSKSIDVHKTFWAALGITTTGRKKAREQIRA